MKLFREHQYDAAREAFSHAYNLDPQAETLLELGLSEFEADHPVEASRHLREYLGRSDAAAAKLDVVRSKWLPRAEARTARLDVFARAGAEIRVDGAVPEPVPPPAHEDGNTAEPLASLVIAAGQHDVSARDGTIVERQRIVARGGELVEVHFQRVADALPAAGLAMAPTGAGGPEKTSMHERDTRSRAKWTVAIGLGSAAVVAAGVAIGFSVAVEQSASDANGLLQRVRAATGGDSGCLQPSPASQCAQVSHDRQAERTNAAMANGFYVAAGAAAVLAGAALFLWPARKGDAAGVLRAAPLVGDRTTGVALSGSW